MGIFDKINGKSVEIKVAEYSEIFGEVLVGIHRDVKSLQSKVQILSGVAGNDDGQMHLLEVATRLRILQTKLCTAENLIDTADKKHDCEISRLRTDIDGQRSEFRSFETRVNVQFDSFLSQSLEVQRTASAYRLSTEREIGDVRTVLSGLDRRQDVFKTDLANFAVQTKALSGDLASLLSEHDRLAKRVHDAEKKQQSAAARILALEAGIEVLNLTQDAMRKSHRFTVRVFAGIAAILFLLEGVLLWTTKFAS